MEKILHLEKHEKFTYLSLTLLSISIPILLIYGYNLVDNKSCKGDLLIASNMYFYFFIMTIIFSSFTLFIFYFKEFQEDSLTLFVMMIVFIIYYLILNFIFYNLLSALFYSWETCENLLTLNYFGVMLLLAMNLVTISFLNKISKFRKKKIDKKY